MNPITRECWSRNEEDFDCDTLGELLDNYADELRPGQTVWKGTANPPKLSSLISADNVIEDVATAAYDIGSEYAEDYPDVAPEHRAKLQALLEQWLSECAPPRFYRVTNVEPYTLTEDDFSAEDLAHFATEKQA